MTGEYWFPAKKYGWGWGLPVRWQGWLVFLAYFILLWMGRGIIRTHGIAQFVGYTILLSIGLTAVCWIKGEPPRWRWGEG